MMLILISVDKLEFVSYAPDRLDHPFFRCLFKLFTQTLDVNVYRTGVAEVIEAPYLVKKLIAGKYAVVV